jgi:parvulin-like peptidyl-prolyl isomerase
MKKLIVLPLMLAVILLACGKQNEAVILEQGSPAYTLGKELAPKMAVLDPDSNKILVKADRFRVSAGEVLAFIQSLYGNRTEGLKTMEDGQLASFIKRTTTQLGERKLLIAAAKKSGVKISDTMVDSVLTTQYARTGGEEQFLASLEASGVDFEFVKNDIKTSLLIQEYLQKTVRERGVTEEKVQEAYQATLNDTVVAVRHILLMTQGKSDAEKREIRKKMEGILQRARGGEEFAELAETYSEDPGSKEQGGLYEDVTRGMMVKPFENAAFSVPVGSISDIVETQYGYHILKIDDRKTNDKPLEEMRADLEEKLMQEAWQVVIPAYVEELKESAHFEIVAF